MQESATFIQIIFNIILWLTILVSLKSAYQEPYKAVSTTRLLGILAIVLFCMFPFWGGDYFHYKTSFYDYLSGGYSPNEKLYLWIMDNISFGSYHFYRLLIWGSALLILFIAYKKSSPTLDLCIFIFGVCYLPLFSYARVSLSMALILLGMSIISNAINRKSLFPAIIGLVITVSSVLFHRTAVIGIVASIAAFFLLNAQKKTLWFVLFLAPVIVYVMRYVMDSFMAYDLDYDTFITGRQRDTYMSGSVGNIWGHGWGEIIQNVFIRVPLFLTALIYIKLVRSGGYKNFSLSERFVASYAFCIIVLGIGFAFNWGYNTYVLHYRTLNFALPANAVFLAAVHRHGYNKAMFNIVWWSTIFGVFYSFLYSAYLTI